MTRATGAARGFASNRDHALHPHRGAPMNARMDAPLRPDLSKILPVPWVRQLASPSLPFAAADAPAARTGDYLVEVRRRDANDPDAAGFGIAQARAVVARLHVRLAAAPHVHRLDAVRAQRLLGLLERDVP